MTLWRDSARCLTLCCIIECTGQYTLIHHSFTFTAGLTHVGDTGHRDSAIASQVDVVLVDKLGDLLGRDYKQT